MGIDGTKPKYAIEAIGLEKTYRASGKMPEKQALKGINLQIPTGSIFGLLGPNGAGKSTFINILSGLVTKTGGKAMIWGMDTDQHPRASRAAMGVVPQEITMDPFFTPMEAMELHAGFYGVPKSQRRSEQILAAVGLDDKKDAYVRQLSGGMKRRLMVAKAMVHAPPILILDEATSALDSESERHIQDAMHNVMQGRTTLVIAHRLSTIEDVDRIVVLDQGQIAEVGTHSELLSRNGIYAQLHALQYQRAAE